MQRLLGGERWRPGPRYGRLDTNEVVDAADESDGSLAFVALTAGLLAAAAGLWLGVALLQRGAVSLTMLVLYALLTATVGTLVWHRRRVYVFCVAFKIRADYKAAREAARALDSPTADELQGLWAPVHDRSAERMHGMVTGLAGLWVKTAQLLATRADILPDAFIRRFKTTQDTMPAQPFASVQAVMASELRGHGHAAATAPDAPAIAEVFEWVDPEPLASASIAQVHRARLRASHGHREVVIKVQHDGVDALMMHDLETVRLLTNAIARLEPDMDFRPLLDAWCREVPKELDFRVEAQNMAEVAANLATAGRPQGQGEGEGQGERDTAGDEDPLRVEACLPRVVPELTSRRLLVMSYEEGARLTEPDSVIASGVDIAAFIKGIARAYAKQMFMCAPQIPAHPRHLRPA
jgi:aarF domain-containing kinase